MPAYVILANYWAAYYKILLFTALHKNCKDLKVLYIGASENIREWELRKNELTFSHEIMFEMPVEEVPAVPLLKKTWNRLNALDPSVLIIDGYSYAFCWAGLFWAKINKKRVILWSSSNEGDHRRVFHKELVKKFFVKKCDAYNVYGTKSKAYLIKLGAEGHKVTIVGNNTDNDFYFDETSKLKGERAAFRHQYGLAENNFLYVGRFSKEKNVFHLLDAYRKVAERDDRWGLILVGNGPQKKDIEDYIQKYRIKNVSLPGFMQKSDIPKFLAVSDVLVLPSISEPWGIVVNEAMAAGLPVLVSRKCGCYPDIVWDDENGFSFNPLDKSQLYHLMGKIVDGRVNLKKMGESSLHIIKNYTPERAARIIIDTINYVAGMSG